MNFDGVREVIETTFKTEFGTAYPAVPVQYENVRFKQPTGSAWVDIRIIEGDYVRQNLGSSKKYRGFGAINVTCLVPEESGSVSLNGITDKVFTILADRQWNVAGDSLNTYGGEKRTRGVVNGFYAKNVMVEFRFDTEIIR